MMLHKLRRAMVAPEREPLRGESKPTSSCLAASRNAWAGVSAARRRWSASPSRFAAAAQDACACRSQRRSRMSATNGCLATTNGRSSVVGCPSANALTDGFCAAYRIRTQGAALVPPGAALVPSRRSQGYGPRRCHLDTLSTGRHGDGPSSMATGRSAISGSVTAAAPRSLRRMSRATSGQEESASSGHPPTRAPCRRPVHAIISGSLASGVLSMPGSGRIPTRHKFEAVGVPARL